MGIPLVRTKLSAYAIGAMFGGMSGAFLGTYYTAVNAGQFQFGFSIFILAMVIIGGLGSIWGAVVGGLLLGYINNYLIPDVLNSVPRSWAQLPADLGGVRDLRVPARDRHGAATAGADPRAPTQARAAPPRSPPRTPSSWRPRARGPHELRAAPAPPAAAVSVLRVDRVTKEFGGLVAGQRRLVRRPAALDRVADRAQRGGQDDALQHAHRALPADRGRIMLGERDITHRGRTSSPATGSRGPFRTSACSAR